MSKENNAMRNESDAGIESASVTDASVHELLDELANAANTDRAQDPEIDSKVEPALESGEEAGDATSPSQDFAAARQKDAESESADVAQGGGNAGNNHQLQPTATPESKELYRPNATHRQSAAIALPSHYDAPQLVGVTVSTVGAEAPEAVGLADLGVILRRNGRMIALIVLLITALSAFAVSQVTPRYTATTSVLFEPLLSSDRGVQSVLAGLGDDDAAMQSQVALLNSSALALRVIDSMSLDKMLEFSAGPDASRAMQAGNQSAAKMETLKKFRKRFNVEHVPGTRVINLSFSSANPEVAADTVNSLTALFMQDQRQSKFGAIRETAQWLSSQVSALRERVAAAELEIESFKLDAGLAGRSGMTLSDQELSSLNAQLIESRAQSTEARTRLNQVRALLASPNGIDSAAEVLDSSLIQRLREQESTLLARMAEVGAELGDKHPRLLQMQAEAEQVQGKIDSEISKIVNALEYQYNIASAREQAIKSSLSSTTGQLETTASSTVQLNAMEREVAADRVLLSTLLERLKQVSSQVDSSGQESDARVIAPALTPIEPSFPMTIGIIALAAIGSVLLAIMTALIREFSDRSVRSAQQMTDKLKVTPLGIVPRTSRWRRKGLSPFQYAVAKPRSQYAESARAFAQAIQTLGMNGKGTTIIASSANHGEGKTESALCLANALSLQGKAVMVIDADHFAPRLHDTVNTGNGPGLAELLERRVELKDAVYTSKTQKPFAVIPMGDRDLLPSGAPNYKALRKLITTFKSHFDYIIVVAPPVLISNDAVVLSRLADTCVLAMRWGKTHRQTARLCVEKLTQAGCKTVGGVLTDVNLKKYELYEYGQSGRCTNAVKGCYVN